jgi:hypothetical protein
MNDQTTDLTPPEAACNQADQIPGLLHGMAYRTPVCATIKIGSAEEVNGTKVPVADDHFTINSRFRDEDGKWVRHPSHKSLEDDEKNLINGKLRKIPVKVIYDRPNLNIGEQYAAFTQDGRQSCVGNGHKAKRVDLNGHMSEVQCPGSDNCQYGQQPETRCKVFTRALFHLEGQDASENAFIFRTSSYNSVNDMRFRLEAFHAGFGKMLSGLPLWLTMRLKSSAISADRQFWYTSLEPRFESMKAGIQAVKQRRNEEVEAGFDRNAYETAISRLLGNGAFNETMEDMEEFEDLLARPASAIALPAVRRGRGEVPDLSGVVNAYAKSSLSGGVAPGSAIASV